MHNFFANINIHIKIFLQASSSALPILIIEEISTRMISDIVKNFNMKKLIKYLKKKNLKFNDNNIKILYKKKISDLVFLELTEKKFKRYSMKGGPITVLVKFIESFSQKLCNYFSYKTLNDLKKILYKNKVNGNDITNIKQFLSDK